MFLLVQRAILALCLCSLFGCSSPCRQWEIQEIVTRHPCFNGGKLILSPDSDSSHLELELSHTRSGIRFYINLLCLQAKPWQEDPSRTCLEIIFENQEPWIIYPFLLEGGQRILLPKEIADILIQTLLEGHSFIIQMGRSKQLNVIPDNFSCVYERLLTLPIEQIVEENDAISCMEENQS